LGKLTTANASQNSEGWTLESQTPNIYTDRGEYPTEGKDAWQRHRHKNTPGHFVDCAKGRKSKLKTPFRRLEGGEDDIREMSFIVLCTEIKGRGVSIRRVSEGTKRGDS